MALFTARGLVAIASSGGNFPAVFQGNPNVTITVINTSGGIASSRTSGQLPAFVMVSASTITASGTSDPYADLEYSWNFGDSTGTETFTDYYTNNGATGTTVNSNNSQTGPEAAYVYRTAGTFVITLSIRGKNGGSYTTATKTLNFTVSAFNASGGEWYYDSNATGANNGTSPTNAFTDLSTFNTKVSTSNTAIHIAKASTFSGTAITVSGASAVSGVRVDTYGSGSAPSITVAGVDTATMSMQGSQNKSDFVWSGINFLSTSTGGPDPMVHIAPGGAANVFSDIYLDNCSFGWTSTIAGVTFMPAQATLVAQQINFGTWNCTFPSTTSSNGNIYGYFGTWGFAVGGFHDGTSADSTHDHDIYPNIVQHGLFRYINFAAGPRNRGYNINVNYGEDGVPGPAIPWADGPNFADYQLISNNNFNGVGQSHDASNSDSNSSPPRQRNLISQRNLLHDMVDANPASFSFNSCVQMTFRDNNMWQTNLRVDRVGVQPYNGNANALVLKTYRNKFYGTGSNDGSGSGIWSLWFMHSATDTGAGGPDVAATQTFTDNVTWDDRTTPNFFEGSLTSYGTFSSIVNRNQWYAPNAGTGNRWYNNTTTNNQGGSAVSQATWQGFGFDSTISTANPGWSNPSAGVFQ